MSDEAKGALTAEEWAKDRVEWLGSHGLDAQRFEGSYVLGATCCGCYIDDEHNHRIAALALAGQDFGFTAGDVAALRYFASSWNMGPDERASLESLASRIASLLPPALPPNA